MLFRLTSLDSSKSFGACAPVFSGRNLKAVISVTKLEHTHALQRPPLLKHNPLQQLINVPLLFCSNNSFTVSIPLSKVDLLRMIPACLIRLSQSKLCCLRVLLNLTICLHIVTNSAPKTQRSLWGIYGLGHKTSMMTHRQRIITSCFLAVCTRSVSKQVRDEGSEFL